MDQADCVLPNPLQLRRLPDKILLAFHEACDQGDLEIARRLLDCCEMAMRNAAQPMQERRRAAVTLCAAHERLWLLRNRDEGTRSCGISKPFG
ncbi:hypothetical protein [Falsiroseomonas sp.]|uniref:hypothetical protein n=1 Tax=Falsiroseomonas sp. TaxID=2870721 RepID=UPI00272265A3|nr:hypothetical protein [Falsiroseomonas sp.]MDO9501949.1 hypothetical protein [Falsiroseomonas sp.]